MVKSILIIGNGFDIEHNLPTKYVDFLDLTSEDYKNSKAYSDLFSMGFKGDIDSIRKDIKETLGDSNTVIQYIRARLEENQNIGNNWVDFEQEIARAVKYAERKFYGEVLEPFEESEYDSLPLDFDPTGCDSKRFHEDFYRLLCAFEIYISRIVNTIECQYYSDDIQRIRPDLVISLNYSNTYERLYSKFRRIDYIHGKALIKSVESRKGDKDLQPEDYRDANHIILGMNEYLDKPDLKEKTEFIAFRKYFQRITKHTGIEYRKFLNCGKEDSLNVYVFGHSLDPTDSELLSEIIGHEKAKTTIFYHNESAYISEVTNLIKIFGKEFVIDKCHGDDPDISFRLQKKRVLIQDSACYYTNRAIDGLLHFKCITQNEFTHFYELLAVQINNASGFESQIDAIRAYDVLRPFGLETQFKDAVYKLIEVLPAINKNGEIVNSAYYDLEEWMEPTFDGRGEVPKDIANLLNYANSVNAKRAKNDGIVLLGLEENYIHPYEKHIPNDIKQDEYARFIVQMIGALGTYAEPERVWKLLERVTTCDSNIGAQVELEGIKNKRRDIFSKAVCNYLEKYLDDCAEQEAYNEYVKENYNDVDNEVEDRP